MEGDSPKEVPIVSIEREVLWAGTDFNVIVIRGKRYVMGTDVASMLSQSTYNLYTTARRHGIEVVKAEPAVLQQLSQYGFWNQGRKPESMFEIAPAWDFIETYYKKARMKRERQLMEGKRRTERKPSTKATSASTSRKAIKADTDGGAEAALPPASDRHEEAGSRRHVASGGSESP